MGKIGYIQEKENIMNEIGKENREKRKKMKYKKKI